MVALARHLFHLPRNYVALDLETTGFAHHSEAITEIGAVKIRNSKITDSFSMLINPGKTIAPRITQLTGITNEMVSDQPYIDEALPQFLEWLEQDSIIGHNLKFDLAFLSVACENMYGHCHHLERETFDTMHIDRQLFPTERHRLLDLIQRYGIDTHEEHRALSDATQTYQCLEWQRRYIACGTSAMEAKHFDEVPYELEESDDLTA